eukprot:1552948-Amphidinium_carterae.1
MCGGLAYFGLSRTPAMHGNHQSSSDWITPLLRTPPMQYQLGAEFGQVLTTSKGSYCPGAASRLCVWSQEWADQYTPTSACSISLRHGFWLESSYSVGMRSRLSCGPYSH